jgi:hypothetical protein
MWHLINDLMIICSIYNLDRLERLIFKNCVSSRTVRPYYVVAMITLPDHCMTQGAQYSLSMDTSCHNCW